MCTMTLNQELKGIELRFEVKPAQEVLDLIKSVGYRWSNRQKLWYALQSEKTLQVAEQLVKSEQVAENKQETNQIKIAKSASKIFDLWEVTHQEIKEHTREEIEAIGDGKEIAKLIRKELKIFTGFKFSVRSDCNYWGDTINVYVIKSPYDEESKYMKAVLTYIEKLVDSYKYCKHYDPYGDYGSSYNIHGYVRVDYDYTQTSDDVTEIIKNYDIKEEQAKQKEKEEQERQYQEYLKEEAIKKVEYEKREAQRQEDKKTVENNVIVKNVEPYYIIGGQWANCNKNCTLDKYIEYVTEGDFYLRNSEITKELHFDKETFDLFKNMLLDDFTFLEGMGGSKTLDNRIKDIIDYNKMTKEERETVEWMDCKCLAVYCDNKLMFIINPEGFSYARYVGLVDCAKITKNLDVKQELDGEELQQYKEVAEAIEDISFNVIAENDIVKTWNTISWNIYRKEMLNKLRNSGLCIDDNAIRQIESIPLKESMYRLISETDSLQDQFTNADIKEGDKLTVCYIDNIGILQHYPITYISHELTEYAQYKDSVKVIMKLPNKRGQYSKVFYSDVLIYKGQIDIPDNLFYNKRVIDNGTQILTGLFGSCDKKQYDVVINYLKSKDIMPIINTYKPII